MGEAERRKKKKSLLSPAIESALGPTGRTINLKKKRTRESFDALLELGDEYLYFLVVNVYDIVQIC